MAGLIGVGAAVYPDHLLDVALLANEAVVVAIFGQNGLDDGEPDDFGRYRLYKGMLFFGLLIPLFDVFDEFLDVAAFPAQGQRVASREDEIDSLTESKGAAIAYIPLDFHFGHEEDVTKLYIVDIVEHTYQILVERHIALT